MFSPALFVVHQLLKVLNKGVIVIFLRSRDKPKNNMAQLKKNYFASRNIRKLFSPWSRACTKILSTQTHKGACCWYNLIWVHIPKSFSKINWTSIIYNLVLSYIYLSCVTFREYVCYVSLLNCTDEAVLLTWDGGRGILLLLEVGDKAGT